MKIRIIFTLLTLFISLHAQEKTWFPSEINIQPFTANFLEPKAGFAFHNDNQHLRLDISTSRDIFRMKSDNKTFSAGADLFTFTRIFRGGDFHFPVETIDYLFGFNAGYKVKDQYYNRDGDQLIPDDSKSTEYGFRFRLSHISAHLVDGKYDFATNGWKNDHPIVYSREFIEFFPYYQIYNFRMYAGLTYLIHVTPKSVGKDIYQLGFDYYANNLISDKISPFIAYDFKVEHLSKYKGSNIITAGIKFGNARGEGVSAAFSYYTGRSIHGEYIMKDEKYSTIGINIDL